MSESDKQTLMIVILGVLAVYGAYSGKWEFVTGTTTGLFALLNVNVKKGENNEKAVDSVRVA